MTLIKLKGTEININSNKIINENIKPGKLYLGNFLTQKHCRNCNRKKCCDVKIEKKTT